MRARRLPRWLERELGKLCGTLGFESYGKFLWDLSDDEGRPSKSPASDRIGGQILAHLHDQTRHDPAILAVGDGAVHKLSQSTRNLSTTWNVSSSDLFGANPACPDIMFVVGSLDRPMLAELAGLREGLQRLGAASSRVIVTAQQRWAVAEEVLGEAADLDLVFWRDHYDGTIAYSSRLLAVYLHAVGPAKIVCLRSALGFETIGGYGRALQRFHRLFVAVAMPDDASKPVDQIYNLRACAPFATILAGSEAKADRLRPLLADQPLQGIAVMAQSGTSEDALAAAFGRDFADRRPGAGVIEVLLGRPRAMTSPAALVAEIDAGADMFDVSVVALFHRECHLAVPALASLRDMVEHAAARGMRVETMIVLDNADDETRRLIARDGGFADVIREVAFGDPALVRNDAAVHCRGRFLTFLDGDDLWSRNWLTDSFAVATRDDSAGLVVWHSEAYFAFLASDCNRTVDDAPGLEAAQGAFHFHTSSDAPDFEPKDLLLESLWTVNAFALRRTFLRFPFRSNDWEAQLGIEDWRWNLETLGHGFVHRVVPDTIHLIRVKEGGSLGQQHEAKGLLPFLP